MLYPGERGQWQSGRSVFEKNIFDTLELRHWLSGKISFSNLPAKEAIQQLEKWYDVDIEVQGKGWENQLINGDYQDSPLDDVLKVICFTLSWKYKYEQNKVIIR